jgi:hypothetical protein
LIMNEIATFPDIDTHYWNIKDREWMAARKLEWQRIEPMLTSCKSGKGKTAVKQYFLKGKLPDWEMFAEWENDDRHVDLFMFLWLHPSWDEAVLTSLRNAYMTSDQIVLDDLRAGFSTLIRWGTVMACQGFVTWSEEGKKSILDTDGHNEQLFRVMMGDLSQTDFEIARQPRWGNKKPIFHLPVGDIEHIFSMGEWLCIENMLPINNDMLYQYDLPLEWWYLSCTQDQNYFLKDPHAEVLRDIMRRALWRILNFDTDKEGPGPRTTFVRKMRKILDERVFIKEIMDMWCQIKAGDVQVDRPWDWRA